MKIKIIYILITIISNLYYIKSNIPLEKIKIPSLEKNKKEKKITINKTEEKNIINKRKIDEISSCESASSSANSYDDCSKYNNEENNTICCYVTGVSGSTDSSGCLEVHILFLNKTLEYNSDNVSGKLICTSSKSNSFFIRNFLFYFIVFFVF